MASFKQRASIFNFLENGVKNGEKNGEKNFREKWREKFSGKIKNGGTLLVESFTLVK